MNSLNEEGLSLVSDWMTYTKKILRRADDTIHVYNQGLKRFNEWLGPKHNIMNASPRHLAEWRDAMINDMNYDARSINLWMTGTKAFYKYLAILNENRTGEILFNPWDKIKALRIDRDDHEVHKRDKLSDDEIKTLFETCSGNNPKQVRDRAIMGSMVFGALRTIEVWRMNTSDLSNKNGRDIIEIQSKGSRSKKDWIILSSTLKRMLDSWMGIRDGKRQGALFTSLSRSNRGKRLSKRSIRAAVKERFKQAKITGYRKSTHSLRHTPITKAFELGGNVSQIKKFARIVHYDTLLMYYHDPKPTKEPIEDLIKYGLPEETL